MNATQLQETTTAKGFNNLCQASLPRSSSTTGDRVPYRVARLLFVLLFFFFRDSKFYRYRYGRETGGIEKKKKTKEVNNRPRERKKEEEETEDKEKEKEGEEVKLRRGTQRTQRQQTSQSGRSAPSPIEHRASLLLHHATTKSSTSPAQEQPYGCSCPSVGRLACRTASCRILSLAGPCHRLSRRRAV